jgi:hypothetical protein
MENKSNLYNVKSNNYNYNYHPDKKMMFNNVSFELGSDSDLKYNYNYFSGNKPESTDRVDKLEKMEKDDFSKSNKTTQQGIENAIISQSQSFNTNIKNSPNVYLDFNDKPFLKSKDKDRATKISDIVIKIFSSKDLTQNLKEKFGKDFIHKLISKEADTEYLKKIEEEVKEFEELKEKFSEEKNLLEANYNQELITENSKKIFNNYTKPYSYYFDPKIQYGGSDSYKDKKLNSKDYFEKLYKSMNKPKGRVDFNLNKKFYSYREYPHGWRSAQEFFINERNQKISASPDKITSRLVK